MINRTPRIVVLLVSSLLISGMSPFDDPEFEIYMGQVVEKYCVEQHFRIYKFQPASQKAAITADVDSATCRSNYALENDTVRQFYNETLQLHLDQCTEQCQQKKGANCAVKCDFGKLSLEKRNYTQGMTLLAAGCRGVIHEVLGGPVQAGICSDWKFKPSDRLDALVAHADLDLNNNLGDRCVSDEATTELVDMAANIAPIGGSVKKARRIWTELGASCQQHAATGNQEKRTVCHLNYGSMRVRGALGMPLQNKISISLIENADGKLSNLCASVLSAGL